MHKPFVPSLLSHLLVVISTVLATALLSPDQSYEVHLLEAPSDASSHTILVNASALSLNASDLNAMRAQCSGTKFGTSLNATSCRNAIYFIPAEHEQRSFGARDFAHSGATYDVELPYRWLSRTSWGSISTTRLDSAGSMLTYVLQRMASAVFRSSLLRRLQ